MNETAEQLSKLPPITVFEPDYVESMPEIASIDDLSITHEGSVWTVEGEWLEHLVRNINFSDYESRMYFDRSLRNSGLYDKLEKMGIEEGDTVRMYNLDFEYWR